MISKQKRGQITIFVILGIVLLIVAGGFLYMRSQAIDDQGQQEVDELTPQEFGHVKKFVDTCVYEIAKEGLMIIGEKGGYVNPLQSGVMAVPGFPTKGNGFEFAPQTNLLIPYWYYMSSADSCVTNCDFESKQPMLSGNSVNSIESQLRRYVANNINNCLKDFEDFKEQGLDIERSEKVDVIIIIGDESIVITLDNSLTIKQDDQLVTISKFTAELDVKLKQMYELATQIVNYESSNNTKFLEMFTREVIALGSMGSDKKIPPMRGLPQINLKGSDYWLLPDVKSELENQLMMNIPTLQLLFSRNSAIFETGDPYID
ncbi:MAG: hypothetical protein KKF89_00305, partial [Nanoarchaeota archaeon]|nr:hypothetical protein [Nanoarchaeota archaeon]